MKRAFAISLLALVDCGCSEPPTRPHAGDVTEKTSPAVRYDRHDAGGKAGTLTEALVNPFSADTSAAEHGESLFGTMNCDGCHGGGGLGFTGPSLVDGRWRYGGEDGALFHSIVYGRPNGMPAYGELLSDGTVWQLVSYIRSRPVPGVVPTVAWPLSALAE